MITMKNWSVLVPAADKTVAYQGDHLTRRLEIETDLDPDAGWTVFLDLEKFGEKNTILLTLEESGLVVDLTGDMLAGDGVYSAQLRGLNGELVAHSNKFALRIADSINAIDSFPPMEPTAMAQLEARIVAAKVAAETAAEEAKVAFDILAEEFEDTDILPAQELILTSNDAALETSNFVYQAWPGVANYETMSAMETDKEYVVIWDGTEYTCTAVDVSADFDGVLVAKAVALGNMSYARAECEDTGEPFYAAVYDLPGIIQFAAIMTRPGVAAETVTHTVYIYQEGGYRIREEQLPDGLATEEYVNEKVANVKIEVDDTLKESGMAADSAAVGDRLALIEANVAELMYEPIEITSFTKNTGTTELGDTVDEVTLTWETNKAPAALTLDGESLDPETVALTLTGLGLTTEKRWTLIATDERGATDSGSVTQGFNNRAYYGAAAEPETIDSAFLLTLQSVLTGTRKRTVTVTAAEGEHIWYAVPARLGACTFKVGGFEGGFVMVTDFDFTNALGYTESYYVYRSNQNGLGETAVEVS